MSRRTTLFPHILFFGMLVTYICLTGGWLAGQRMHPGACPETDRPHTRAVAVHGRAESAPARVTAASGIAPAAPLDSSPRNVPMPTVRFFPPAMTRLNYLHS